MLTINSTVRWLGLFTLLALSFATRTFAQEQPALTPEQLEFFEKRIRPVLAERCHKCHGEEEQEANLRLDSRGSMLKGGETGPAIVPGKVDEGELLAALAYEADGYQMPPDGKLPDEQIADFRRWVEMGAPWPGSDEAEPENDRIPKNISPEEFARRAEHWSFQPLVRHALPAVKNAEWARTPVDRFILSKLDENGLSPAGEADKRTWLRRVFLDTIGLPPTPQEIEDFLADAEPGAEERVVDRLLVDPHFGERWGRHWLDLVRYAESRGHEFDYDVANPWHYRDYVIRALNDDVPYDQFVVEHVAGDLLRGARDEGPGSSVRRGNQNSADSETASHPSPSTLDPRPFPLRLHPLTGANESIVATGFWFFGEWIHSPVDIRQDEADRFDNMIDVYSKTFLGLTVSCARCHDHKFDPITQKDFYALQGYLQSSAYRQARFETMEHNRIVAEKLQVLKKETSEKIVLAILDSITPTLNKLEEYTAATHTILNAKEATEAEDEQTTSDLLLKVATEFEIDSTLLSRWVEFTSNPSHSERDPVFESLGLVRGREPGNSTTFPPWNGHGFAAHELKATSPAFRLVGDSAWNSLDLEQSKTIEFPLVPVTSYWSLADTYSGSFSVEPSTDESGAMQHWLTSLGSVYTPTFEITSNYAHFLIRGGMSVYLAVDSHRLIKGPLHGSLTQEFASEDDWRWVKFDISRYKGHRAHLEFFPQRNEPLEIAYIEFTDRFLQPDVLARFDRFVNCQHLKQQTNPWGLVPHEGQSLYVKSQFLDLVKSGDIAALKWALEKIDLFVVSKDTVDADIEKLLHVYANSKQEIESSFSTSETSSPAMIDISGEDEYVFLRGNWKKRGEVVPRRFLEVFKGSLEVRDERLEIEAKAAETLSLSSQIFPSGRYELALQMVDAEQTPILARVIVNRIWQHYFGRGLVNTPDDFGHLGQLPSHPELLDWLATELVGHEWSLKHIHRLILASAAYRMATKGEGPGSSVRRDSSDLDVSSASGPSTVNDQPSTASSTSSTRAASQPPQRFNASTLDPDNVLLHRMNVKRLEGEIIRDSMLAVSGRLNEVLYGKSTPVHLTPFMEGRGRPAESGPVDGSGRRSLYIAVRRNFPDPFLQAFDFPNPHSTIGKRTVSNVPAQALALLNNPLVLEQSQHWAQRTQEDHPGSTAKQRIERMFEDAFARSPTESELAAGEEFLKSQAESYATTLDDDRPWQDYAHVLLNLKEFIFVQ